MLIGQNDFVKIGRDRYLVVFEITQPGPLAPNGLGQQGKNLAKLNRHGFLLSFDFGQGSTSFVLGTVVNSKLVSCHVIRFLTLGGKLH